MKTEHFLSTLRRRSAGLAAALLTPAMMFAAPLSTGAQEADPDALTLRSYPLAIHQGTCETAVAEPAYDLGFLVPRALFVEDDDVVVDRTVYDTGVYDPYRTGAFYDPADPALVDVQNELIEENIGLLYDDINDDRFLDYGLDLDRDLVLDEAEIIERPIIWAYENDLDDIQPAIVDDDVLDDEPEVDDLRATPHVLMIHRDTVLDTNYLACGQIQGGENIESEVVFGIRPVSPNGFVGIAEMQEDEGGFLGIGREGDIEVWVMPSRAGQVVGQAPANGAAAAADDAAEAVAAEPLALVAAETGFDRVGLTAPVGEVVIAVENPVDVDRVFVIPDLGVRETLAAGETTLVTVEPTAPGIYPYMIEGENELVGDLEIVE